LFRAAAARPPDFDVYARAAEPFRPGESDRGACVPYSAYGWVGGCVG